MDGKAVQWVSLPPHSSKFPGLILSLGSPCVCLDILLGSKVSFQLPKAFWYLHIGYDTLHLGMNESVNVCAHGVCLTPIFPLSMTRILMMNNFDR